MSTPAATARPTKAKIPLVARVLLVGGVAFGVLAVAAIVSAIRPTDVARLSVQYPAIEDRTGRKPPPDRDAPCALSEEGTPGSCKKAVVTDVRDEEVSFPSRIPEKGLARLKGTLSIPVGPAGKRPAIILIHGSGPNGRDEPVAGDLVSKLPSSLKLFAELADFFARQGIVVLRYDKRVPRFYPEMGHDKGHLFRWSDLEMDGRDALDFLATRAEVAPDRMIVAGHSEGGQLAPYVAHENPRVVAVIMLAGLLETVEQGLMGQLERLAVARHAQWDPLGAWSVREQGKKYGACFEKLGKPGSDPEEVCLGGGVTQAALADYQAYVQRMPGILASDTSVVMAVQGSVDRNIDPEAIPKIGRALSARDHELHYIPGMNHDLVNVVTPTKPPKVDPELLRRLTVFLASVRR